MSSRRRFRLAGTSSLYGYGGGLGSYNIKCETSCVEGTSRLFALRVSLSRVPGVDCSRTFRAVLRIPNMNPGMTSYVLLCKFGFERTFPSSM